MVLQTSPDIPGHPLCDIPGHPRTSPDIPSELAGAANKLCVDNHRVLACTRGTKSEFDKVLTSAIFGGDSGIVTCFAGPGTVWTQTRRSFPYLIERVAASKDPSGMVIVLPLRSHRLPLCLLHQPCDRCCLLRRRSVIRNHPTREEGRLKSRPRIRKRAWRKEMRRGKNARSA